MICSFIYFLCDISGVFLPKLCQAMKGNARRELIADFHSSGDVATAPVHSVKYTTGPVPALAPALSPFPY